MTDVLQANFYEKLFYRPKTSAVAGGITGEEILPLFTGEEPFR